jgi:hypothetical protein
MLHIDVTHGVCAACVYGNECAFEAEAGRAILQCEQFEMAFPAEEVRPTRTQSRTSPRNGKDSSKYAGICSNCENRETCSYPKPEGGVWRCEEYV